MINKIKDKSINKNGKFINPFPQWDKFRVFGMGTINFALSNKFISFKQDDINQLTNNKKQPNFNIHQVGELKVFWLGHSTILIQDNMTNILFDPIFVNTISAVLGNYRFGPLPCTVKELPKIDAILISHDHYDHCDINAIYYLQQQYKPEYFIGLNSKSLLPKGAKVNEMDWFEQKQLTVQKNNKKRKYKIKFVPACHWSGRSATDAFTRLWGGFIITTPQNYVIYFAGDTGKCNIFDRIAQQHQIDLALLPIGAYQPNAFLCPQHINPEQAVEIHKKLKPRLSIGIHWGTYKLSNEGPLQPREDLNKALDYQNISKNKFITMAHGEARILKCNKDFDNSKNRLEYVWYGKSVFSIEDEHSCFLINFIPNESRLLKNQMLLQRIQELYRFSNSLNVIILMDYVEEYILDKYIDRKILILSPLLYPSKTNVVKLVPHTKMNLMQHGIKFEIYCIDEGCLIKNGYGQYIWLAKQSQRRQFRSSLKKNMSVEYEKVVADIFQNVFNKFADNKHTVYIYEDMINNTFKFNDISIHYDEIKDMDFQNIQIYLTVLPYAKSMNKYSKILDEESITKLIQNIKQIRPNHLVVRGQQQDELPQNKLKDVLIDFDQKYRDACLSQINKRKSIFNTKIINKQ